MSCTPNIKSVSIIGMGALGLLYGERIAAGIGKENCSFVMDAARAQKYGDTVFTVNDRPQDFRLVSAEDATPSDLVIVAVKFPALRAALDTMKNCVGPHTILVSVMNGIESEEIIAERYGMQNMVYTVAQGMDAMKFGSALRYTQYGKLHIGVKPGCSQEAFDTLVRFFDKIDMPYVVEEDILYRMWFKYMLNVGVNQTCMVYNTTYGGVIAPGTPNRTLVAAMREVMAIAACEGVTLTEADLNKTIEIESTLDPNGTPSMGQDRINRRHSEVDMFAGTVMRLGKKHGIRVPENEFLYQRAKEIEQEY